MKPLLGRTFLPEMLGRDREVVLSYGLWKSRYDGDPLLVGYTKTDFGRGANSFIAIARLKPGVSVGQGSSQLPCFCPC
ncbi:MAG: hypothetical protein P4L56_05830 [Candidatus Sulfopaludibacter sp.]|nr:hypothetical protein [Candidatus Sulfopaludibacter sp.]